VVTGVTDSALPTEPVSAFARLDRPAVLLIGEPAEATAEMQECLQVVFSTEKICSGMRAFMPLRMAAVHAGDDPLISEHGEKVPRVLVIDPVKERIAVLEGNRVRAGVLFKEMARASKRVWKENLTRTVKAHAKLLVKRDTLHDLLTVAKQRLERAEDEKERADIEADAQELEIELENLRVKERALWLLTRKWTPPVSTNLEQTPEPPALPQGWKEHKTADGKCYYERPDGTTTWDRPAAP